MKQKKLVIYDEEEKYVSRLTDYINKDKEIPLTAAGFTDYLELSDYLAGNKVDLLLLNDSVSEDYYGVDKVLYLSKQKNLSDMQTVFKYGSADAIVRQIYDRLSIGDIKTKASKEIIGIYSPVGRSGKTRMALSLCRYSFHGAALYFGMEEYSGFKTKEGFSEELLYYIKQKNEQKTQLLLEQAPEYKGVKAVETAASFLDSKCIKKQDVEWLLQVIKQQGRYALVVFDIGAGVLTEFEVLDLFQYIYVPFLEREFAKEKLEAMYEILEKNKREQIIDKMQLVEVPDCDIDSERMRQWTLQILKKN